MARRRARRHAPRPFVGVAALAGEVVVVVAWRTPAAVAAVQAHHALVVLEAACLVTAGIALWLALVASPPLEPRPGPARRVILAAVAMWALWIVAYVAGMAHGGYPSFPHSPGHGLSADADRQLATAVLFAAGALAYLPVIFANLFAWLRAEDHRGAEFTSRRLLVGPADGGQDGVPRT